MDKLLFTQLFFFTLIAVFGIGAAIAFQKRRIPWSIACGILAALSVVGLVLFPLANTPEPNAPEPVPAKRRIAKEPKPQTLTLASLESFRPIERQRDGYTTSHACLECHQEHHKPWHASYHRTMTQVATPDAVIGDFDDVTVQARGREYRLQKLGDTCWVEMHDPNLPPSPATRMRVPIVMTTGSHHMQVYWYPMGVGRTLGMLPIVYVKETEQWLPRNASFLKPPDHPVASETGRWNEGCSKCHATNTREREVETGFWDTQVSQFGISCEACHGPGERHIAYHRGKTGQASADPIVNPANLSSKAASDVCGQCHSVHSSRESAGSLQARGHSYRPGRQLSETHHIWQRDSEVVQKFLKRKNLPEEALGRMYWDDGMVRVSGREFNGLVSSGCYQRGELSCLSCHSLHQTDGDERSLELWADDQLSLAGLSDKACTQCHAADQYGEAHTHHPAASSGSRCYNCHMPHTSYGLLKAIRSHTITSPDISKDSSVGRPNACNLCHLDRTLQWSASAMKQWYGHPTLELTKEQNEIAASILWLLKGDAGQRALAAWSFGWQEAQIASGTDWMAPLLAELLTDPYDAVRMIVRRSIRSLPGFGELRINAVAPRQARIELARQIRGAWTRQTASTRKANPPLLMSEDGLQLDKVRALAEKRDDRPVDLLE